MNVAGIVVIFLIMVVGLLGIVAVVSDMSMSYDNATTSIYGGGILSNTSTGYNLTDTGVDIFGDVSPSLVILMTIFFFVICFVVILRFI